MLHDFEARQAAAQTAAAENARKQAEAGEAQRKTLYDAQVAAATAAEQQRKMMFDAQATAQAAAEQQRQMLMTAIEALNNSLRERSQPTMASPSAQLFPTPAQSSPGGSAGSATVALPPELLSLLRQREEDDAKVFSSHTSTKTDFFSGDQLRVLRDQLPEYRILKKDAGLPEFRAALRVLADCLLAGQGQTHEEHLQAVVASMVANGRTVGPSVAAELQLLFGITATARGAVDWPRVAIAELGVLAHRGCAPGIYDRLKVARSTLPDAHGYGVGILACLPIRKDRNPPPPPADPRVDPATTPRKCRTCGKMFVGGWTAKACKAGHPPPAKNE
jgi:hypothetical protein